MSPNLFIFGNYNNIYYKWMTSIWKDGKLTPEELRRNIIDIKHEIIMLSMIVDFLGIFLCKRNIFS